MLFLDSTEPISKFCSNMYEPLGLVGWLLTIFKIAIPLIIVVLGMIDLGKAAISAKPDEVKKTAVSLIWRVVGGIAIFILPAVLMTAFGFISGFNDIENESDFEVCYTCIVSPSNCESCKNGSNCKYTKS